MTQRKSQEISGKSYENSLPMLLHYTERLYETQGGKQNHNGYDFKDFTITPNDFTNTLYDFAFTPGRGHAKLYQ